MRIKCTVREFAQIVRDCDNSDCNMCAFRNICEENSIEEFVRADDITDGAKEDNHDR